MNFIILMGPNQHVNEHVSRMRNSVNRELELSGVSLFRWTIRDMIAKVVVKSELL